MSSDDCQIQNIYRYSRKTLKKNRRAQEHELHSPRENLNVEMNERSPRSDLRNDDFVYSSPGCSCEVDQEADAANILHKKCPVINLAQQQLQRLLDETDKLLSDNPRCSRPLHDFLYSCKELLLKQNKYILLVLIAVAFIFGILLGAATCGSYLGRYNSPILTCIDNFFISETYPIGYDNFLSIV
ncbi:uncharacterized protein LOC113523501 [Galleria mellonella]|uniref:Uncharacterized protein LOC113523501 n=1 Tax=Galleria mellonella TaxID=7137 RepID=A0A6J1X6N7_GALME|nr:uncharacterized protein LOC113523501 [Galleria mellonella]